MRSSMRSNPMSASIERSSPGECGTYLISELLRPFFLDVIFVFDRSQKRIDLRRVLNRDRYHPTLAIRILVDLLRRFVEVFIDLADRPADRHINFADRFHTLD